MNHHHHHHHHHHLLFFIPLFDRNGQRITAQQPAVPEVQPPAAQDVSNILRVVEAKKPKKACDSGQKQQSSLGSKKDRIVPSTKSDSYKSQAGQRSNLVPVISNSATVQKSVKDTSTFSSKNVTRHFSHPD